jgi:hypothetical protein
MSYATNLRTKNHATWSKEIRSRQRMQRSKLKTRSSRIKRRRSNITSRLERTMRLGPGHEAIVKLRADRRELQSKIDAPIMKVKKYKTMVAEHHHGKGS